MEWSYSENLHRRETIEQVAGRYLAALRGLIANTAMAGEYLRLPDLDLIHLNKTQLGRIIRTVSNSDSREQ